ITTISNTGSYSWPIPSNFNLTDNYGLKIRVVDASDENLVYDDSDNGFKIRGRITVGSPAAGNAWMVDNTYSITWTTTGIFAGQTVKIDYSLNDFGVITTVIASTVNASNGSFSWKIPDTITNANVVKVRVRDNNEPNIVYGDSAGFKIRGNLTVVSPNGNEARPVNSIQTITWTSIGSMSQVRVEFYAPDTGWQAIAGSPFANVSGTNTCTWTVPNKITYPGHAWGEYPFKFRVSDNADPNVTSDESDNGFKIRGAFNVTYPTASGITVYVNNQMTLTWNTDGTVPNVILEYSKDNFVTPKYITTTGNAGSYVWTVPDDISVGEITKIRVSDTRDATVAYDISDNGFRIRGWFQALSPNAAGTELKVNVPYTISWNTNGTMPNITIEWSKVGDFSDVAALAALGLNPIVILTNNVTGTNTYAWNVPDQITAGFTAKVRVKLTGDDTVYDISDNPFKIRTNIVTGITTKAPNTPPNQVRSKEWVVMRETQTITWTTTGTVPLVTLRYSTDGFVTNYQDIITNTANSGSYVWTIPDLSASSQTVTVRVYDANDANVITGAYGVTQEFIIDYYHITFNVKDDVTQTDLDSLNVDWDYPGTVGKEYYTSPIIRNYPYGTFTTLFTKINFSPKAWTGWTSNNDQAFTLYMESSLIHQWGVIAGFDYNADTNALVVTSWFERNGLILLPGPIGRSVAVNIYDQTGTLIQTLSSSSYDTYGVTRMTWANTTLQSNTTYWAKVDLVHEGKSYSSAKIYNIAVPAKLKTISDQVSGVSGQVTTAQTYLTGIKINTDLLPGIKMTLEQVQQQTEVILPEQLESLKTSISSLINTKIEDLATDISEAIVPAVRSRLINRPDSVKTGEDLTIVFQGPETGLSPTVDVYDSKNNVVVSKAIMTERPDEFGSGSMVYEYKTKMSTGWGEGDFTVVANDPKTGAMDTMTVSVIGTKLDEIKQDTTISMAAAAQRLETGSKLDVIQANLATVTSMITQMQAVTEAGTGTAKETTLQNAYNEIVKIAGDLNKISQEQGLQSSTILQAVTTGSTDVKGLEEKLKILDELREYNKQILEHIQDKWIIYETYEWGSIILKINVVNNESVTQKIKVKYYLPKEVQGPQHVVDLGGLVLKYDATQGAYYVEPPTPEGKIEVSAADDKRVIYTIELKDIWSIPNDDLDTRRRGASELVKQLAGTAHYTYAVGVFNEITQKLYEIRDKQDRKKNNKPEVYIAEYRKNLELLKDCDVKLDYLRKLVNPPPDLALTATGLSEFGKGKGGTGGEGPAITAAASWRFILVIVTFLGILSVVFFLIWQQQLKKTRVSPELVFSEEELRGPDAERTKTGETSLPGNETNTKDITSL
ncbi:MAG: hypothetical protein AAB019_11050, partial [Planctomycetota bacterium]